MKDPIYTPTETKFPLPDWMLEENRFPIVLRGWQYEDDAGAEYAYFAIKNGMVAQISVVFQITDDLPVVDQMGETKVTNMWPCKGGVIVEHETKTVEPIL